MKIIVYFLALLSLFTLSSCTPEESDGGSGNGSDITIEKSYDETFSKNDLKTEYNEDECVKITLSGDKIECSSDAVTVNGTTATLTADTTYIISGELSDGMIAVRCADDAKPRIILDGVNITSSTSAPIYVIEADKVFVTLAEGSNNLLQNGGEFINIDENNIDSVIFSKADLTINGNGGLKITSPAGHGIVSKDDLKITGGNFDISAASHGISANDGINIASASFSITSGKDAIQAENDEDSSLGYVVIFSGSYDISASGDGISASSYIQIDEGEYSITAGGGASGASSSSDTASTKGIKASGSLAISGGKFAIDSADDAIHSNTSVKIAGGEFDISTGDDGMHADESLSIEDGKINITKSYEGLEALDISISGGDITIVSSDDGINAAGGNDSSGFGGMRPGGDRFGPGGPGGASSSSNGSITISGGKIYMNASGDGIDANGSLTISGGHTTVCGPTSGDTSVLDYDNSANITGGTFIGTGAYQMAQTFSDSSQGVLALTVGTQSAGTSFTLTDSDGNTLIEGTPKLSYQILIVSTPDMVKGEEYTITVGELSGSFAAQ